MKAAMLWQTAKAVVFLFCCSGLAFGQRSSPRPTAKAPEIRPNVVLILSDDQDYADASCFDHPSDIHTPNIDRLAKTGVRLSQSYSSAPVCAPSRAGLMTGRYQQRFGCYTNLTAHGVPEREIFLPKLLSQAGYATAAVGKWHLGLDRQFHPMGRGFDLFYGFLPGMHDYFHVEDTLEGRPVLRGFAPVDGVEYLTCDFGREAAVFIENHRERPFFLYLAFNAVHTPYQAPADHLARFHTGDNARDVYLAMLNCLDEEVGHILDVLERARIRDRTLIIFLSDNGGTEKAAVAAGGARRIRGHKGQTLEGGIRVPMIVSWPGRVPAGSVYTEPVIALDIFPTVLAAAGIAAPDGLVLDGKDLLPHLCAGVPGPIHDTLFWYYPGKNEGNWWAVRRGDRRWTFLNEPVGIGLFQLAIAQVQEFSADTFFVLGGSHA